MFNKINLFNLIEGFVVDVNGLNGLCEVVKQNMLEFVKGVVK